MISFMMSGIIPSDIMNTIPAAGIIVLILTKVIDVKEAVKAITGDMVFMIASMSAVSTILSNTGVGKLIGQTVLNILGGHPAPIFVIAVFCIVTSVMTNFMSNMGTTWP